MLGGSSSSQKVLRYFLGTLSGRLGGRVSLFAAYFKGTPLINAANSLFLQKRSRANWGALTQKRGSACASDFIILEGCALVESLTRKLSALRQNCDFDSRE